jgi:Aminoglycoside-2''-adenylyltransferase
MTAVPDDALDPDLSPWDAWRPGEVASLLRGVAAPWYVAGGWALDLFAGEERRPHEDLEIAVPNDRFAEIARALAAFELFVTDRVDGADVVRPFSFARAFESNQTWVREPASGTWRLDVFREPADGDVWICRRDGRIRMTYGELIERTPDGIPYAVPEVVLLFKAKHSALPKNETDLADLLPRLGPARLARLAAMLALAHPGHPWLGRLDAG